MGLSTLHISPSPPRVLSENVNEYLKEHRGGLTKTQLEYISIADDLQPKSGRHELADDEPYLEIRVGASLAKVSTGQRVSPGGGVGGVRGVVGTFSSSSRRRLMRSIASIDREQRPVFITLTYPDEFPADCSKWKRDIDVFGKRFARAFPLGCFVWRIEFIERKSGQNIGRIAPHFHLLAYNVSYRKLRKFCASAWYDVVGSGDEKHLLAGCRVEEIYTLKGIMRYAAKYIAKEDTFPENWQGRAWGWVGRKNIPFGVLVRIALSGEQATRVTRLGRKMIGAVGRSFHYGITWIVDTERVLDYLEVLLCFT